MVQITFIKKITYVLLIVTSGLYAADQMVATAAYIDKRRDDYGLDKAQRPEPKFDKSGDNFLFKETRESRRPNAKAPWAPIAIVGKGQNNSTPTPQVSMPEIPQPAQVRPELVPIKPIQAQLTNTVPSSLGIPSNVSDFLRDNSPTNKGRVQTLSSRVLNREHFNRKMQDDPRFAAAVNHLHKKVSQEAKHCIETTEKLIAAFKNNDSYTVAECLIALEHATISEPVLNKEFQTMLNTIIFQLTDGGHNNFLTGIKTHDQLNKIDNAYNQFNKIYFNYSQHEDYSFSLGNIVEPITNDFRLKAKLCTDDPFENLERGAERQKQLGELCTIVEKQCTQNTLHNKYTKKFFSCELYRSLVKINAWCSIGAFKEALAEIACLNKKFPISSIAIRQYHQTIYDAAYRKSYTPQGIQIEYKTDPLCPRINAQSRSPNEALNALFARRKEAAEKTLAGIGCSKDCNELTRTLAYDLIDCKNHRAAVEMLSKKLSNDHANPEVRESYSNYFYSSGVSKLTQCDPILANFDMPHEIGNAKNHELRMLLDDLATVSAHTPQIKDAVVKVFGYVKKTLADNHYSKAYETIARAINTALHDPKADQSVLQLADLAAQTITEAQSATQHEAALSIADILDHMKKTPRESAEYQELLKQLYTVDELYKDVIGNAAIANAYLQEILKESTAVKPELIAKQFPEYYHWLKKRVEARIDIQRQGPIYETQHYPLEYQTKQYLSDTKIDSSNFKTCTGDQVQRTLHGEAIHVQGIVAQRYYETKAPIATAAMHMFNNQTGAILNKVVGLIKTNNTDSATQLLDLGWNLQARLDAWQEKAIAALHSWNDSKNDPEAYKNQALTGNPAIDADLQKQSANITSTQHGIAHALINGLDWGTQTILHPLQSIISVEIWARNAGTATTECASEIADTFRKPPNEVAEIAERKAWQAVQAASDSMTHILSNPHARGEAIGNAIAGWFTGKTIGYFARPVMAGVNRIKTAFMGAAESTVVPIMEAEITAEQIATTSTATAETKAIHKSLKEIAKIEKTSKRIQHLESLKKTLKKDAEALQQINQQLAVEIGILKAEFKETLVHCSSTYGQANTNEALQLLGINETNVHIKPYKIDHLERISKDLQKINSDPRWQTFKYDSAKGPKSSLGLIDEAIAGISCEEQNLIQNLARSTHDGADFVEIIGKQKIEWDVKTFPSFSLEGKEVFTVPETIHSIKKELMTGTNVILNIQYLNEKDLLTLYQNIAKSLTLDELKGIIVVHPENFSLSKNSEDLIKFLFSNFTNNN